MSVTAVHPDSASLELHLEVGRDEFRRLGDLITLREIQVYGSISKRAREMLEEKAKMLGGSVSVTERFAGFARVPQAGD
jgi:broad specificity phosphatase PhoE